jgi:hypothetical protein
MATPTLEELEARIEAIKAFLVRADPGNRTEYRAVIEAILAGTHKEP